MLYSQLVVRFCSAFGAVSNCFFFSFKFNNYFFLLFIHFMVKKYIYYIKMDVARLITEVYKRNGIWDHNSSCHYMRDAVAGLWYEIADVLEAPVDAVKAKWRNLRDTYTAECRKMYKRSRDKEPMVRSKWVWFASMDFLRPHLKRLRELQEGKPPGLTPIPGRSASAIAYRRLKKVLKDEDDDDDMKEEDQMIENVEVDMLPSDTLLQAVQHLEEDENGAVITEIDDDSVGPGEPNNSHSMVNYGMVNGTGGGRKRPWNASTPYSHPPTDRKRSRQRALEEELSLREVDDTFHFLISLREPLKSLALDRQMFVRYKIQELLFNETYDHQKSLQNEHVEHVETTPEIMVLGNIKMEPPN